MPRQAQDAFVSLYALNIDVARVADSTSHPSVGTVRMQFWRDTVTKSLAGNPPQEPAAILLAAAHEDLLARTQGKSGLSQMWLHQLINARDQYLGGRPYPSLQALETYAENTYSTLMYLTLSAFPVQSITADHVASHIGKAVGIAAVLRGLPLVAFPPPPMTHHTSNALGGPLGSPPQGALLLPLDVMAETNVQEEQVMRHGPLAPNIKDAIFVVATRANDHLLTAREMLRNLRQGRDVGHEFEHDSEAHRGQEHKGQNVDQQVRDVNSGFSVLLSSVSTSLWLQNLQAYDFDIFDARLRRTDWRLPFRLMSSYFRRKI
jgi:NADH dehydrogenase [ubiquinone] 1 alpha subcomplex assembly factor 6